jgi:hypothetical protein
VGCRWRPRRREPWWRPVTLLVPRWKCGPHRLVFLLNRGPFRHLRPARATVEQGHLPGPVPELFSFASSVMLGVGNRHRRPRAMAAAGRKACTSPSERTQRSWKPMSPKEWWAAESLWPSQLWAESPAPAVNAQTGWKKAAGASAGAWGCAPRAVCGNARWAAFDRLRGSQAACEPCAGAKKPQPATHAAGIAAAASHTGGAAAGHTGSCRTIGAAAGTATRAEHSADAGMRRRDCGGRASEPAGEADSTAGGGRRAAFPDGKGWQAGSCGPASWGRCCCLHKLGAGRDQAAQRVRQRGEAAPGNTMYVPRSTAVVWGARAGAARGLG